MRQFRVISAFAVVAKLISLTHALVSNNSINSQTRLAYAGSTGMMVSWNTFAHIEKPTVMYGLSVNAMTSIATSDVSVTYQTSLTYNNHVKITGLTPDTMYYYMPTTLIKSNGSTPGPFNFKTSKLAGDMTTYSIAVVVDMGTMGPEGLYTSAGTGVSPNNILAPGEINTVQSLASAVDQFEFLWHPGDIAYADTWLKEEIQGFEPNTTIFDGYTVYESILNEFYDEMTPITTSRPYMVGPGNHEANCDNGGTTDKSKNITYTANICMPGQTNFTGYINHFRMPSIESGGVGNFWYSFDYGMTHYVQFDTETDLGHGLIAPDSPEGGTEDAGPFALVDTQAKWLAADLAAVDRSKTPWVVLAGHRPWYSSGSICTACQEAFETVLYQNQVDLVLSGHFHVYERNAPVTLNGTADPAELNNPSSPWYITNGAAGHYDGLDSFTPPIASYQRFGLSTSDGIYGWSKLTFHNCTHLTHEFINSANGTILDSATLYKNRTCSSGVGGSNSSTSAVSTLPTTGTGSSSVPLTTSSLYTTSLITVTSCAPAVTSCSLGLTQVITSTIALYETVCPVSKTSSAVGYSSPDISTYLSISSGQAGFSSAPAGMPSASVTSSAAISSSTAISSQAAASNIAAMSSAGGIVSQITGADSVTVSRPAVLGTAASGGLSGSQTIPSTAIQITGVSGASISASYNSLLVVAAGLLALF